MKKPTRAVRDVAIGVLRAPIYLVAGVVLPILYAFMVIVDLLWPEDPRTMTDEEKRRYYGYGKDL